MEVTSTVSETVKKKKNKKICRYSLKAQLIPWKLFNGSPIPFLVREFRAWTTDARLRAFDVVKKKKN